MKRVTIALLHPSAIICAGISGLLSNMRDISITLNRINIQDIGKCSCHVIIADPISLSAEKIEELRSAYSSKIRIAALYTSALPAEILRNFDATISIYDSVDVIESTLRQIIAEEEEEDAKVLSQREKDVVVGIVKGMSNKEIAAEMGVSVNTVMTHRRNIASKLQIHSPAGLTIYAIVSKLVRLDEIKTRLPR